MDRLGRRGEGLEDVGHAGGRIGGERRTDQKGRGNKEKGSSSDRPAIYLKSEIRISKSETIMRDESMNLRRPA